MNDSDLTGRDLERAVLGAFRSALESPIYASLLEKEGVDPEAVGSLGDFLRLVPILRKDHLFRDDIPFHRVCRGGELGAIASVMVSSGFSGRNSFAVATADELSETAEGIDSALDLLFGSRLTPTLLINAFPMGIHLPTRNALAETGPRSDFVLKILKQFGPYFGQSVILGDPHLLKEIVDEGNEAAIDWRAGHVSFVAGQDWLPQTLRSYIHAETGIPDDGARVVIGTMGLTELGFNVFFESRETIRLRRLACVDDALRSRLFPHTSRAVPSLFHYDPNRFVIESIPHREGRELVVTALSAARRLPMIRYATGDLGDVWAPAALRRELGSLGLSELAPALPLPCAWVAGRAGGIETSSGTLRKEQLRHGLYSTAAVAGAVTGHFTIHGPSGAERAAVQLRRDFAVSSRLRETTEEALFSAADLSLPTDLYTYEEYPFGKALNYEVKFRHST